MIEDWYALSTVESSFFMPLSYRRMISSASERTLCPSDTRRLDIYIIVYESYTFYRFYNARM